MMNGIISGKMPAPEFRVQAACLVILCGLSKFVMPQSANSAVTTAYPDRDVRRGKRRAGGASPERARRALE